MPKVIRYKKQMYDLLGAGAFENTVPSFLSLGDWRASPDSGKYPSWGLRVLLSGDKRGQLNIPTKDVVHNVLWKGLKAGEYQLSPMIDEYAKLRCQLVEAADYPGLRLEYFRDVVNPALDSRHPWRDGFARFRQEAVGSAVWPILREYCTPADEENLRRLLEEYPGHVIEFTVCGKEVGLVPGCRAVVWEVRLY